jgi:hypothetical protein
MAEASYIPRVTLLPHLLQVLSLSFGRGVFERMLQSCAARDEDARLYSKTNIPNLRESRRPP